MYKGFILESKTIHLQGYHWELENPDAVICLIHGIGEHAGRYDKVGEFLKESNYALLSMDLRGHGKSPGKRAHAAPRKELFEDVDALIQLAGDTYPGKPILLYGHSLGGNICLDYRKNGARNNEISGYIVTAPWLILHKKIGKPLMTFARILSKFKPDFVMNTGLSAKDLAHVECEVDAYIKDRMVHKKISVLTAINGIDAASDILSEPSGNRKPLLLMHGSKDKICAIEGSKAVKDIEGECCTFIEWDGLFHEIHNEKNGRIVLGAITSWIRSQY